MPEHSIEIKKDVWKLSSETVVAKVDLLYKGGAV